MPMIDWAKSLCRRLGVKPSQPESEWERRLRVGEYSLVAQLANCEVRGYRELSRMVPLVAMARRIRAERQPIERPKPARSVAELLARGPAARPEDYRGVKSGRDQYSRLGYRELAALVDEGTANATDDLPGETAAKVMRWVLRGLPLDMARAKVAEDERFSEVMKKYREREERLDFDRIDKDDFYRD